MNDAQRANLHMLETWPRELIRTHYECGHPLTSRTMQTGRPSQATSMQRRAWIRQNVSKMSQKAMAEYLGITPNSVSRHVKRLGVTTKWTATKGIKSWLLRNAEKYTIYELAEKLDKAESTIWSHLHNLGISARSGKLGRARKS